MKQPSTRWNRFLHGLLLAGAMLVLFNSIALGQADIYIAGPTRVCVGTPATYSSDNELCTNWSWSDGDVTPSSPGYPTSTTITWASAGTYRVTLSATCQQEGGGTATPSAFLDVIVEDPPANQFISIPQNAAARNVTTTSATICAGADLHLLPPPGAVNCVWSTDFSAPGSGGNGLTSYVGGEVAFNSIGYPRESIRCTLNYQTQGPVACQPAPLVFTINVAVPAEPTIVAGTERFGPGPLDLTIQNYQPAFTYTWYEDAALTTVAYTGGPTFTPTVNQSRSYYLVVTSCGVGQPEEIKVLLRRVQITVNGQVPTRPVTGTSVLLQADPATGGPYTWLRDGEVIAGASGPQLTATEAGLYTVRLAGGTGPEYESLPVEVLPLTQIKEWTVLKPGVTDPQLVASLPVNERSHRVTYANSLGQPIQQLAVQAGPGQEDVVQHVGYEGASTTASTFLPFPVAATVKPSGDYEADPLTKLNAYYASKGGLPSSSATVEASPLSRPLEQTQTGTAWAGHSSRVSYAGNDAADAVRRWQGFDGTRLYAEGQLSKAVSLDPDNRRTEVFTDQLGRVVLQRKLDGTARFDTYTVYADAGYVQAVIPPAAVQALASTGQWNIQDAGFKDRWLYQYTYDNQGRVVERKFPGAAPVYLVYDAFDRPILVQDGNHRTASGGQWLFTKFDAQNRPVAEGIWQDGRSRRDVQDAVGAFTPTQQYEIRNAGGYSTDNTFPAVQDGVSGAVVLSLTFYDDYDLNLDGSPDYSLRTESRLSADEQPVQTPQARGLTTVTRRRVVQPGGTYGDWLTTAMFYDQYGNVVQKQGNNLLQPNASLQDVTTLVYREQGFVPQVRKAVKTQNYGNATPAVVRNRFTYDPAGRLLQTWQQNITKPTPEPEILLSSNRYTGLGELTQKKLHSRDQGTKFLQKEDFAYNLHGQLQSINSGSLKYNSENDLFGLSLVREQANGLSTGNTPRYDGGISAVSWMVHNGANPQSPPERERSYRFAYDGLGRLNAATYAARVNPWDSWTLEQGAYDEKNITYDANGNIMTVDRWTQRSTTTLPEAIDKLTLSYDMGGGKGNRMTGAYDALFDSRGFRNNSSFVFNDYAYDANGSMTHDGNKGVDYVYNALNKVERQTVGAGNIATTFDASGKVLRKVTTTAASVKTETYVDGFVYESSPTFSPTVAALRSVPTPEGRAMLVQLNDPQLTYEYHLRDHLGNLRVAFRAQAGTEDLRLSSEDPDREEGTYPKFENVAATQSQAIGAYHGSYSAAVTNAQNGPAISIPVSHGDHLKVRVRCNTPYGVQYYRTAPSERPATAPRVAVAPALLPVAMGAPPDGRPSQRVAPGLQVSLSGLLSGLVSRSKNKSAAFAAKPAPTYPLNAYLAWTLVNDQGQTVRSGYQLVPVYTDGQWRPLDLPLDIDLSGEETRTGTLRLREVNDASNPVFFDSLTITRPQDRALVSQENHYYPFGMALSGVAVNTTAQPQVSKDQFNGGSELQDELLGSEQGIYSTFYRNYDPATGRFQGVDPLADKYAGDSPYSFSFNDPINFSDPNGDEAEGEGPRPLFVNGRYVTPHIFDGGGGGWVGSGGGWDGSYLSSTMQQGWVGVSGFRGTTNLIYRNGQWGSYAPDNGNGTGQYKFVPSESGFPKVDAPGFGESLIPIWGSGKQAIHDYQNGDYGWAAFNAALAISDVFLVKYLATAAVKSAIKLTVSSSGKTAIRSLGAAAKGFSKNQFKSVSKGYLAKNGITDIHAFKQEYLGDVILKHFDVVKHTLSGELLIIRQSTQQIVEYTGIFL